jgi:hypothetical protein
MGVHVPDHVEVSRFGAIRHSVALLIDLVELLQIFMEEESSENTLNLATRFATNALIAFGETPQLKESLNQELFNQEWFEFAKWLCGVSDSLSNARKIDQMYRDEMRQSCIPMIRTCKSLIEESENIKARRPAERWRELVAIFERTKSTYYDLINRHDILKEANESIERAEETS